MSSDNQTRWDRQHALSHGAEQPATFLKKIIESHKWRIPLGEALDIATGQGRNALYLAEQGFAVHAIDISPVALAQARRRAEGKSLSIEWQQADLEQIRLPPARYELIVSFNYLQRSLMQQIKTSLKAGGFVIFETYLIDQQSIGHPKNAAYLLRHNELLEQFRDFRVMFYREGNISEGGEAAFRAGIFAQKIRLESRSDDH
ncbi:MAG: class I SAM-dependent methyltransferase [Candidatus Binatia bacterium]